MHDTPCESTVKALTKIELMEPAVIKMETRVRNIEIRTAFISGISAGLGGLGGTYLGVHSQQIVPKVAVVIDWLRSIV